MRILMLIVAVDRILTECGAKTWHDSSVTRVASRDHVSPKNGTVTIGRNRSI